MNIELLNDSIWIKGINPNGYKAILDTLSFEGVRAICRICLQEVKLCHMIETVPYLLLN
jgi:hypothetical protein